MRTKNSFINMLVVCISYAIVMVGTFVVQKFFVKILGLELAGINGNFSRIVLMLTIVELGLSSGITYKLYKPLAEENWKKVSIILRFLKKSYFGIAALVLGLGLVGAFFVGVPVDNHYSRTWLALIFILYICDVLASYLFCHKRAMFLADQKFYVNKIVYTCCQVLMFISQITVLILFKSLELFLMSRVVCRVLESSTISFLFNKRYKQIDLRTQEDMPEFEKKDLFRNMKALFLHKISGACLEPALSIIILNYVNLRDSGIYTNYMMIAWALTNVTNEIFSSITASFGNLLTTAKKDRIYPNFKTLYFLNFLIYSFVVVAFFNVITPFMNVWLPVENAIFSIPTTISIAIYIYIYGMMQSANMVKRSAGIYKPDQYISVFGIFVSVICSWVLAAPFGVAGIMVGSIIGLLAVPYWCQPYLVYKNVFELSVKSYHITYAYYTILTVAYTWFSYYLCSKIICNNSILQVAVNFVICLIIPNSLNILIFFKTREFKSLLDSAKRIIFKKSK